VIVDGDTLFNVYSRLGPCSAEERARAISERLDRLILLSDLDLDSLLVQEGEKAIDLRYKNQIIMTITRSDAEAQGMSETEVAEKYLAILKDELPQGCTMST